ncbi:MAG: Lrp/AsnC family transcriptional regulator [Pseudomonadota bacterium]
MEVRKIDDIDRKIVRLIQKDATLSVQTISDEIGLSHTPCWRRIKRLEKDGVILARVGLVSAEAAGLPVCVFAQVTLKSHAEAALSAFEEAVQDCKEIMDCHEMSGDTDYLVRIVAPDIQSYERFLKKTLLNLPNVGSVNTSFALKEVKRNTALPI